MNELLDEVRPSGGDGGTEQRKAVITAPSFLGLLFSPLDRVAVLALNRTSGQAEQRIVTAEQAAREPFQRWLRYKNANGSDIYLAPNSIRDGSRNRTTQDIACIRHCWIDLDANGDAALAVLQSSALIPHPSIVLSTSKGKYQALWHVDVMTIAQGGALNRALAATFGGDPASCDVAHVLRWPEFTNRKYNPPFWVTARLESTETYGLADFHLELEIAAPRPESQKVDNSSFITTEAAPSPWDSRPEAGINEVLEAAGYILPPRSKKATCPVCGHTAVSIDRKKGVYFCFGCQKGDHIGSLARLQGKRLAF